MVLLWQEVRNEAQQKTNSTKTASLSQFNAHRALFLAKERRFRDAMRSLYSQGCASQDDGEALKELQERHPSYNPPDWSPSSASPLCVDSELVLEVLKCFPRASSPGFSRLLSQHLLDAIVGTTTPSSQDCLDNMTKWICLALSGGLDHCIAPWLTGAPLTALHKKQGQAGIRPIAVGEVLRHLISRICCNAVCPKLPDILLPYGQVGVGVPGGLEAAVHSLSHYISQHGSDPDLCCLKIDMTNAFNNCDRASFLRRLHIVLPELYAWVLWSYHSETELHFGKHHLKSAAGVQQGDPLGPLLFSLVILELIDDLGHFPDLSLQLWYLDDGTLVGTRSSLSNFLELVKSKGLSFGLHLNVARCEVFWPSGDQFFSDHPSPNILRKYWIAKVA